MQWLLIEPRMNLLSVPAPSLPVRRLGLNNIGLGFVADLLSLLVRYCIVVSSDSACQALSRGEKRAMPSWQIIDGI
jgi:hypothetical protein